MSKMSKEEHAYWNRQMDRAIKYKIIPVLTLYDVPKIKQLLQDSHDLSAAQEAVAALREENKGLMADKHRIDWMENVHHVPDFVHDAIGMDGNVRISIDRAMQKESTTRPVTSIGSD